MIEVYSKPNCVQCSATKRLLQKLGLIFTEYDVTVDEEAYARVESLGYKQLPVVVADGKHWSGFQPDNINELS